ncbi:MAG TPA: PQQ-binding-like beta-propeller repeat protein, partial [Tepidisphaeraceae bacterium]|nr:PQQ-binding-like beta-propeller repeat protein [Tepidisphaeraceae bacterium]
MKKCFLVLMLGLMGAGEFKDPAPPKVDDLVVEVEGKAGAYGELKFHAAPKPLAAGAVTNDWPRFLGPNHNATSSETKLLKTLPGKMPVVWEAKKGTGYGAPAIVGDRLILFHRVGDEEVVECLQVDTGLRFWQVKYATAYQDRYGYCDGPRASPVIDEGRVYTIGAEGAMSCLDLKTGHLFWQRKLLDEFKCPQNFFGVGSTPLVEGNLVIVNLGAPGGPSVAGFDKRTGKMVWGAGSEWGPSYASPIPAVIHGKKRVLV